MSKPSFENIDRWFFEYTEGNLSPAQVRDFEHFLDEYPELHSELHLWKEARLEAPAPKEMNLSGLQKPETPYAKILMYTSAGLALFLFGFFTANYFQNNERYSAEFIDISVYDLAELQSDDPLFANEKTIVESKSVIENRQKTQLENSSYLIKKTIESKNRLVTKKNNRTQQEEVSIEEPQLVDVSKLSKVESSSFEKDNKMVRSEDLSRIEEVIAAKNTNTNYLKTDVPELYSYKKADMSKTFQRKVKSVIRKIKRMANYPVALKSTKNKYFHVPMMTGFAANYGMVGSARGNRIQMTTRSQWANSSNQQYQNAISWDGYINALRGGLGIDVTYNNFANSAIQNSAVALTYSPKFSVNKNISIEPAVRFKMGVNNLNAQSNIIGTDIELSRSNVVPLFIDGAQPIGSELWYRDLGLGLMVNTKWFYAGANIDNIGRHYNNYYSNDLSASHREDFHFTGIMGAEYESRTRKMKVNGYALYQNFGDLNEFWVGMNAQFNWLQVGLSANDNLGMAGTLGVVQDKFAVNYNIDRIDSRLAGGKLISHQLTLQLLMKSRRNVSKFTNI